MSSSPKVTPLGILPLANTKTEKKTSRLPVRINSDSDESKAHQQQTKRRTHIEAIRERTLEKIKNFMVDIVEEGIKVGKDNQVEFLEKKIDIENIAEQVDLDYLNSIQGNNLTKRNEEILINVLKSAMMYIQEKKNQENEIAEYQQFYFVTFFEVNDELTDVVTVVFYFLEGNKWGGFFMLSIIAFCRFVQFLLCFYFRERGIRTYIEAIFGLKTFFDTRNMIKQGRDAYSHGSDVKIRTVKMCRRLINIMLQTFPQTVLNTYLLLTNIRDSRVQGTGLLWVQLLSIGSSAVAVGIVLANFAFNFHKRHVEENRQVSTSNHIPSSKYLQQLVRICMGLWYTMHYIIVSIGLGVLILYAPFYISISTFIGYMIVFNLIRAIIYKGHLQSYFRTTSSYISILVSCSVVIFVFPIITFIMPKSTMRLQNIAGPSCFAFGWISSFLICALSVFILIKNIFIRSFFALVCILYLLVVIVFFLSIKTGTWKTFLWSTVNWSDTLRDEIWYQWNQGSQYWNIESLNGDENAHYAGLIARYNVNDLPWDKLKEWLMTQKSTFLNQPPLWLSTEWISCIPLNVRNKVWDAKELQELCNRIVEIGDDSFIIHINNPGIGKDGEDNRISSGRRNKIGMRKITKYRVEQKEASDNASDPGSHASDKVNESAVHGVIENSIISEEVSVLSDKDTRSVCLQHIERRRSSLENVLEELLVDIESNDSVVATSKHVDGIRYFVTNLLSEAEKSISLQKVFEKAETAIICRDSIVTSQNIGESVIQVTMQFLVNYVESFEEKNREYVMMQRVILSTFFEIADELSDMILTIYYFMSSVEGWAAHLMITFILLRRIVCMSISRYLAQEGILKNIETLVGMRCLTDTYYILKYGHNYHVDGAKIDIGTSYTWHSSASIATESAPQMLLQMTIIWQNVKAGGRLDQALMAAQIITVLSSCFTIGLAVATTSTNIILSHKVKGRERYPTFAAFLPSDHKRQSILFLSAITWYSIHILIVSIGLSALITFASSSVSLAIIIGFLVGYILNRGVLNRGDLTPHFRLPTAVSIFITPLWLVTCFLMSSLGPSPNTRLPHFGGPFIFFYCWQGSFWIGFLSILYLVPQVTIRIAFALISLLYFLSIIIYFCNIEKKYWHTFVWSTSTYKDLLRNESWDLPWFASAKWKVASLRGDLDASRAMILFKSKICDIPWDKAKSWLLSKKEAFLEDMPVWMSKKWIKKSLPRRVQEEVWSNMGEFEALLKAIEESELKQNQKKKIIESKT